MNVKKDFPIFKNNKSLVYFDNASTTQKPQCVIDKIIEFYTLYNANIHRGAYTIAEKATFEFEKARQTVANFINANNEEIVFTKGTTESLNLIAYTLGRKLKKNDEIIISEMEHHSNILPWQMLKNNKGIKIRYIPVLDNGMLNINKIDSLINTKTKLISIIHMSNVLGIINPIDTIISKAEKYDIPIIIDAAQSISHQKINVKKLKCDFLMFSGHKIMGPTGVGVLYINKKYNKMLDPFLRGGNMIKEVNKISSSWNDAPWKFEAGTANIAQVLGLATAIDYLNKLGIINIKKHNNQLLEYLLLKMKIIDGIKIYGHQNKSGPIVSFNIDGCHPYDIAKLLDNYGICIRSGHHCAQLLMKNLKINYASRISLHIYNTIDEIDYFTENLNKVVRLLKK